MDTARFDQMMTSLARTASRRTALGGLLAGAIGLLAREDVPARKKRRTRRCKSGKVRCGKSCVNTNTSASHCGRCNSACASGEQCLNGRCFSEDTCPILQEACPNFRRCGIEDSDCFCGGTTGGESICFQDEDFCESPRPCNSTADCAEGRVCLDSSLCCTVRDMPEVPRTCVLPCANRSASSTARLNARQHDSGLGGPGRG